MKPILLICLSGLWWGIGCQNQESEAHMPMDQMKHLLTEIHLANALAFSRSEEKEAQMAMKDDLVDQILAREGLDRETFYQQYQYYIQHPALLDSVYAMIMVDLEQRKEAAETAHRNRKR